MSDNKNKTPFFGAMLGGAWFAIIAFVSGIIHKDDPVSMFFLLGVSTLIALLACLVPIFDAGLRRQYLMSSKTSELVLSVVVAAVGLVGLRAAEWIFDKASSGSEIEKFGQAGDFVGGIFNPLISMVTLIFVFFAFRMQRKELENSDRALMESREASNLQRRDNAKALYLNYLEKQEAYWLERFSGARSVVYGRYSLSPGEFDEVLREYHLASEMYNELSAEKAALILELKSLAGFSIDSEGASRKGDQES